MGLFGNNTNWEDDAIWAGGGNIPEETQELYTQPAQTMSRSPENIPAYVQPEVEPHEKTPEQIPSDTGHKSPVEQNEPSADKPAYSVDGEDALICGNIMISCDVSCKGTLTIEKAHIKGSVVAKTVILNGSICGNITATNAINVSSTSRVAGDLTAQAINLEPGAMLTGRVSLNCPAEKKNKVEKRQPRTTKKESAAIVEEKKSEVSVSAAEPVQTVSTVEPSVTPVQAPVQDRLMDDEE